MGVRTVNSSFDSADRIKAEQSVKKTEVKQENEKSAKAGGFSEQAATLETSEEGKRLQRASVLEQLKRDAENQKNALIDMVRKSVGTQGINFITANIAPVDANAGAKELSEDEVWKLLAGGKFTVSEAAKKEAEAAISKDGYWGVEKTAQRIVEFAKALSGNDAGKADFLLGAFDKAYKEATAVWGKELPDISKQTSERVHRLFDDWKKETEQKKEI